MDKAAARITAKIHREFRHNRLALFDELNLLAVKKHVARLYKDTYKIIKKEFSAQLNPIYQEAFDEALALGFDGEAQDLDEGWIEDFFDEYSPVTKYVFRNELKRKESRLFESLVASKKERPTSYKTAENLLKRQIRQSAIELEDSIFLLAFEDAGVKKVRWVTEKDPHTCSACKALDGKIFLLKDAPPKQHYNCRCFLVPVKG